MHTPFWQSVADTTWWTFAVGIYLIYVAYDATKPRTITLQSMWMIPLVVFTISLISLAFTMQFNINNIGLWLAGMLGGLVISWLQFQLRGIKAIPHEHKLYVPGTWSAFAILIAMLLTPHFFNFNITLTPQTILQPSFAKWLFLSYGLFVGLFAGKIGCAYRCVRNGPYHTGNV